MRLIIILLTLLLSSCTASDIAHHLLEDVTNSDIGRSAASCNQIKNSCSITNQNDPKSYRHYSQWENDDGSIGCSCSNN
mgnify:CR=1 FL=1